jgi:hypothetical protein
MTRWAILFSALLVLGGCGVYRSAGGNDPMWGQLTRAVGEEMRR